MTTAIIPNWNGTALLGRYLPSLRTQTVPFERVLVVDNYDRFVYTLHGYLLQLGAVTTVMRKDAFGADDAACVIAD